jgi:hypothetical protein
MDQATIITNTNRIKDITVLFLWKHLADMGHIFSVLMITSGGSTMKLIKLKFQGL